MRRATLHFASLALACTSVAGCDLTMTRQPKYGPQAPAGLFADGTSAQTPPEGSVAQGAQATKTSVAAPPAMTPALMARGQARHAIFCQPCHGAAGDGDGTIVARGFPRPPSYADPKVRAETGAQMFGVITHGYGVMFPYAERIPVADRWAIVAYVRALQTAHDLGQPPVKPPRYSAGGPA